MELTVQQVSLLDIEAFNEGRTPFDSQESINGHRRGSRIGYGGRYVAQAERKVPAIEFLSSPAPDYLFNQSSESEDSWLISQGLALARAKQPGSLSLQSSLTDASVLSEMTSSDPCRGFHGESYAMIIENKRDPGLGPCSSHGDKAKPHPPVHQAVAAIPRKRKEAEEPRMATRKQTRRRKSSDRQMILDRLAELKKVIPGGEKLTTGGLLDQTVKYMLFLKNLCKYSEKLKQLSMLKGDHHERAFLDDDNTGENGVSWAVEIGNDSVACPVVVRDVGSLGLMLIHMLCEGHEFILVIADKMKELGLNMLSGVTQLQEGKIWASFVMEAKLGITRREVICCLVKLLEMKSGKLASQLESVDKDFLASI